MRAASFIIFFGIALLIYFTFNFYIYSRGLQAFSISPEWRRGYIVVFWVIVSCFVVGEILEHTRSSLVSEWIYRVGAFWLAFMLYFALTLLVFDVIRLLNHFFHFLPEMTQTFRFRLGLATVAFVSFVVLAGHLNALNTRIREISLTIPKKVNGNHAMKIVMASDIHLGALIGENREAKLVRIINSQKPDLVLLCGDLVDGDIAPVLRKNLGKHLQEIKSVMGVYAIPGNHEYIGGIAKTLPYLKSVNIKLLRDSILVLPNGVSVVGRDDRDNRQMGEENRRKTLKELMAGIDKTFPVIVMNHQPFNLEEAVAENVDLHLSGHTHHGQLWPLNYITKAVFELSWGYLKKGETNFYVSSGFGSWGPPVRIGNTPEVVVFNLTFKDPAL
ncbi:MAG: metallophosphoesterase [Mariniphaga sp.]